MIRWNLAYICLFSRDGRRLDVELKTGAVNVICGDSNTGKSALIEIIDYTMGSSRCRIADFIRRGTAWVASVWIKEKDSFVLARRIPPHTHKSTEDCLFIVGGVQSLPTDGNLLQPNANREGLLHHFAQALGMGSMVVQSDWGHEQKRVGPRATAPFLFQSSGVITNPSILLRGLDGDRRQSIIDSFPYLIGAVDEETVELIERLRGRRRQERILTREITDAKAIASSRAGRAETLLTEAIELGLLPRSTAFTDEENRLTALRELRDWKPTPGSVEEDPQLNGLYDDETELVDSIGLLRARLNSARELRQASSLFGSSVTTQKRRLESLDLLADVAPTGTCAFCGKPLYDSEGDSQITHLRNALLHIRSELEGVSQGRPRLDAYIREIDGQIDDANEKLRGVRAKIQALVKEHENILREIELDGRRHRAVGRISLFLDALDEAPTDDGKAQELNSIRAEIAELESRIGREALTEAINEARDRINYIASQFIGKLPFDENYRGCSASLNLRNLEVSLITAARAIPMEDVGSDENWLTLHLAFALAFHRMLEERNRPVPGLLVIDQISRPYYPDTIPNDNAALTPHDEESLSIYVQALFDEVAEREGLQILLLEHARLRDNATYRNAVIREWETNDGLIPKDWPIEEAE